MKMKMKWNEMKWNEMKWIEWMNERSCKYLLQVYPEDVGEKDIEVGGEWASGAMRNLLVDTLVPQLVDREDDADHRTDSTDLV